jgi:hypothetical protein
MVYRLTDGVIIMKAIIELAQRFADRIVTGEYSRNHAQMLFILACATDFRGCKPSMRVEAWKIALDNNREVV